MKIVLAILIVVAVSFDLCGTSSAISPTYSSNMSLYEISRNIIQAEEIEKIIESGEAINYDNVTIHGDLNLNEAIIRKNIKITNTIINGSINFNGAKFEKTIDLSFTTIQGDASFNGASFNEYAGFRNTNFGGKTSFEGALFDGYAYFGGAYFNQEAIFRGSQFKWDLDLIGARFKEDADFSFVKFYGESGFVGTRFNKYAGFRSTKFNGNADFSLSRFNKSANFVSTQFQGNANFMDVEFNENFELTHAKFDRLEVPWRSIKDEISYDSSVYLSLVRSYRNLEWFKDANDCYYDYRKENQERETLGWSKVMDYIAWLTCGYGVRPGYTLAWFFFSILLFGFVFWIGDGIYKCDHSSSWEADASIEDIIYFSANILIGGSVDDFRAMKNYRSLVILERIIGWLLLALFLVTLGRVMIR